ncbi:NAD(P)-dependent oxidoreductase [Erysipelotrichaceae bacterium MTC7]|nr:NAD(P)-dependent oxidoreductase [Erysipelotrichaceae bacterium MTC7]
MKLGIIGSGMIVQDFLPKMVKMDGIEVLGIMSTIEEFNNAKKLGDDNGVKFTTVSFDEMCASGIDTVYVAVPNFIHYEFCKKSLEKGLNVIIEKPMTSNVREAMELKKLAQEKKLFLFEAITTVYLGTFLKIKEWLPRIGEVKNVESNHTQQSRRYDSFKAGEILPAFDPKKAGGALMDLNLYNLHYVMGLFGKPDNVKYYPTIERDIDTNGLLVLNYPKFNAHCFAAKDCGGVVGGLIQGTNGVIRSSFPPNLVGEVTIKLNDGTEEQFDDKSAYERLVPEFTAFINAINDKDYQYCYQQLEQSIAVSEIMTKARLEAGIIFPGDE